MSMRMFSHKSKLSKAAITVSVPPWANRHQIYTETVTASVAAVGVITLTGLPLVGDTITIHDKTWRFSEATKHAQAWEIQLGATAAATVTNMVAAINRDFGLNAAIGDGNYVTAADGTGDTVDVTWCELGTVGNAIVFTESASNLTMDGSGTMGGTTAGVGDGTVEGAAAGTGATAVWYHKAGAAVAGDTQDFTAAAEIYQMTGVISKFVITPSSLTATSSFRVIVHSWKE